MFSRELSIASYNIQNSRNSQHIQRNVSELNSKADVVCLQEFSGSRELTNLKNTESMQWTGEFNDERYGLLTLWSSNKQLKHIQTDKVVLPQLNHPLSALEKVIFLPEEQLKKMRRGALVSSFDWAGSVLRITNLHLDAPGGIVHRVHQLSAVMDYLSFVPAQYEIICGDFNTFGFSKNSQRELLTLFGNEYKNVLPDIAYTSDIVASIESDLPGATLKKTLKFFGLHLRQKLDYIFVKGLEIAHAERIDIEGSDHYPLTAVLRAKDSE